MRALLSVRGVYLFLVSQDRSDFEYATRVAVRKIVYAGTVTTSSNSLKWSEFGVNSVIFAIFMRFSHICAKMRVC